jgi:CubicO group peptidase (beta-lactamase class C family)
MDALRALAIDLVGVRKVAPAAVVAACRRTAAGWVHEVGAAGRIGTDPGEPEATAATVFDLASLTKPVTALLAARLGRQRGLSLAAPLGAMIPEVRGTPSAGVTIEMLLSHRAGLEGHRPLYAPLERGLCVDRVAALVEAARARRAEAPGAPPPEGFAPLYSDLGYLLAGEAIARFAGADLDRAMDDLVFAPLGVEIGSARLFRARDASFDARVAPTEVVAWRGGTLRGQVHDENAWAMSGSGVSGHAGLFGTARAVAELGQTIVDCAAARRADFLTAGEIEPLLRTRPQGTLRAGFDGKSERGSSAGTKFGPESFGHLGFTGTSIWMDPTREIIGVLLTNRVHPTRESDAIRGARPFAYDAIWDWAAELA